MPLFIVIAGPNGAGKTTCAPVLLARSMPFLNADEIALVIPRDDRVSADMQAERRLIEQMDELIGCSADLVVESTLASRSLSARLAKARNRGYETAMVFLWLPSAAFAERRVAERARHGGHSVPTDVIHRRYKRGLCNFFSLYEPLLDAWFFLDNSRASGPRPIATRTKSEGLCIQDERLWDKIRLEVSE